MDNQDIADKLVSLKGRLEFFKSQRADNESKKERLLSELKSLGLSSVGDLGASIEKLEQRIKLMDERLSTSIDAAEKAAQLIEDKLKGNVPASLPPIDAVQGPPSTDKVEEL